MKLFTAVGCVLLGIGLSIYIKSPSSTVGPTVVTSAPIIERVTSIGELCVLKVQVSDMLQAETGDYKASWFVSGDAMISIDLRKARFDSDEHAKTVVAHLPPLQVSQPRVDHELTRWWDTKSVCWHYGWFTTDKTGKMARLTEVAMKEAQHNVELASGEPKCFDQARVSAETVISSIFTGNGYTVSFEWANETESTRNFDAGDSAMKNRVASTK